MVNTRGLCGNFLPDGNFLPFGERDFRILRDLVLVGVFRDLAFFGFFLRPAYLLIVIDNY